MQQVKARESGEYAGGNTYHIGGEYPVHSLSLLLYTYINSKHHFSPDLPNPT